MTKPNSAPLLTAANNNFGGTTEARTALRGLVDLLASAAASRDLARDAANLDRAPVATINTDTTQ